MCIMSLLYFSHFSNTNVHILHMQDFKYQMINKFNSIDNASKKPKSYNDMRGKIYLITSADFVWAKWKTIFERHEKGELIDLDTSEYYCKNPKFTRLKPLVREFFRALQGLSESEMEKAATHILHEGSIAKRC